MKAKYPPSIIFNRTSFLIAFPPRRKAIRARMTGNYRIFTALLIINLLLASCGTTTYECSDPMGCQKISPGSPVVIGAILATSGEQRPLGTASLQSVENAVADHGDLLGHPLKLINYGTDCSAGSAILAATEFATYADLSAVIGPTCSAEASAASSILLNAGIAVLSPVPNSTAAYAMTTRILAALQQVAVQMPDKTLYIPRQALFSALDLSR
jgi:hypothetical protein